MTSGVDGGARGVVGSRFVLLNAAGPNHHDARPVNVAVEPPPMSPSERPSEPVSTRLLSVSPPVIEASPWHASLRNHVRRLYRQ